MVPESRPSARGQVEAGSNADRRQWLRYPHNGHPAYLIPPSGRSTCPVVIETISCGGICLILKHRAEPGEILTLRLFNPGRRAWSLLEAEVKYILPHPDGHFVLGASLTRELSEDELRGLVGEA